MKTNSPLIVIFKEVLFSTATWSSGLLVFLYNLDGNVNNGTEVRIRRPPKITYPSHQAPRNLGSPGFITEPVPRNNKGKVVL